MGCLFVCLFSPLPLVSLHRAPKALLSAAGAEGTEGTAGWEDARAELEPEHALLPGRVKAQSLQLSFCLCLLQLLGHPVLSDSEPLPFISQHLPASPCKHVPAWGYSTSSSGRGVPASCACTLVTLRDPSPLGREHWGHGPCTGSHHLNQAVVAASWRSGVAVCRQRRAQTRKNKLFSRQPFQLLLSKLSNSTNKTRRRWLGCSWPAARERHNPSHLCPHPRSLLPFSFLQPSVPCGIAALCWTPSA